MPRNSSACLTEHTCFQIGVDFCMDCQIIPTAKLAAEYDTFYHTRYPERAKEFEEFVHKIIQLNNLSPIKITRHDDSRPINGTDHIKY